MQNLLYRAEIFNVEAKVEFSTVLGDNGLTPRGCFGAAVSIGRRKADIPDSYLKTSDLSAIIIYLSPFYICA